MPFDGLIEPFTTNVLLFRPSVQGLSYLLRHPDLWPPGFVWNYVSHHRCAIGLAAEYWAIKRDMTASDIAIILGMPAVVSIRIFLGQFNPDEQPVTAIQIADALDFWRANY